MTLKKVAAFLGAMFCVGMIGACPIFYHAGAPWFIYFLFIPALVLLGTVAVGLLYFAKQGKLPVDLDQL